MLRIILMHILIIIKFSKSTILCTVKTVENKETSSRNLCVLTLSRLGGKSQSDPCKTKRPFKHGKIKQKLEYKGMKNHRHLLDMMQSKSKSQSKTRYH